MMNIYKRNDIITEQRLAALSEIREKKREEYFEKLVPAMGEEAVNEVREIYKMFTVDMLIWYAGLWEPEIGGFYFSNSARDHEGFLPDIESTAQAVGFIATMCDLSDGREDMAITVIPKRFSEKICNFAYNLQDEDGFFYHPQWGKAISESRRGRDHGWAWRMIEPLGVTCKYVRPTKRPRAEGKNTSLPEHLQSLDAFKKWLSKYDLTTKSYPFGNVINATSGQIKAAGPEYVEALVEYLNERCNPKTGVWGSEVNYDSVNGLMKLGLTYPGFGAALPYPEQSFESARQAVISDERVTFACQFYNAWASVLASIRSMEFAGNTELADEYRLRLREHAPEMIRITGKKIALTAVGDGSFAYFTADSGKVCAYAQGAPVALDNVREGDINGNGCSTRAPLRHMFAAFGVDMPPFFTKEDAEFLFELMDARIPAQKKKIEI